jgi:hypothetical protein
MPRQIFRKEALDHLSSPEQLDQLFEVASPKAWVALAGVGLLLLTLLVWAFTGNIPVTLTVKGLLMRRGGVIPLEAPEDGIVTEIAVVSGDAADRGTQLMLFKPIKGTKAAFPILSPFKARVLRRRVRDGAHVQAKEPLLYLEDMNQELRARLFISLGDGYQVQKGMEAQVSPAAIKRSEFGYLLGKVRGATKFPINQEDLINLVQNEELARQITSSGPCLQVVVELIPDRGTVSGYKWSSTRGASVELYGGSPCEAQIILQVQKPIQLVFPALGPEGTP